MTTPVITISDARQPPPDQPERRLTAYAAPTALTAEQWQSVRERALCLVRRTAPGSASTARQRLGALCAFLATVDLSDDTELATVLTVPTVSSFLGGRRDKVSARQLANLSAILERLRCTAHGLPYRAGNTADPGVRSQRQVNKARPEPAEANRRLIAQVCRARPVLSSIVNSRLSNSRLEHIQDHLPKPNLDAHRAVLRGLPCTSEDGEVWHTESDSAQHQETEATKGKARR